MSIVTSATSLDSRCRRADGATKTRPARRRPDWVRVLRVARRKSECRRLVGGLKRWCSDQIAGVEGLQTPCECPAHAPPNPSAGSVGMNRQIALITPIGSLVLDEAC